MNCVRKLLYLRSLKLTSKSSPSTSLRWMLDSWKLYCAACKIMGQVLKFDPRREISNFAYNDPAKKFKKN